jgi:predicted PurR-regulated permease PerM
VPRAPGAAPPPDPGVVPTAGERVGHAAPDLSRAVLAILGLLALIVTSLWVLRPFLAPLVWAATMVIATWPLMLRVQRLLWNRRGLAVTAMTVALLLLFFVPLLMAILTIVENADRIRGWFSALAGFRLGDPPAWLQGLPLVGTRLAALWRDVAGSGVDALLARASPYLATWAGQVLRELGAVGATVLQFLVTVVIAAVLFAYGESAAEAVRRFFRRLAGERGEGSALLAAASIRGVAMGVVVTAAVQSALGGIGLAIAGVPAAAVLTAVMFLLTIAQLGPMPVLIPAVIWLFWSDATSWAIALLVWTLIVGTMDNFLRPWLIRKGADMPLLLVFAGVIGGLFAFGLIGIFIGPVVLVVTYRLLDAWMAERPPAIPTAHRQE